VEGHEPPQPNEALDALQRGGAPFLFNASSELQLLRAARLAAEFNRSVMVLGSGTEFRRLDAVLAAGLPLVLPVNFPEAPDVSTSMAADAHSLRDLATWEEAPSNARRLVDGGAVVALTSARLDDRGDFMGGVREAIERGLDPEEALRALTVTPARLLGVDDRLGKVEPGRLAHLVVRTADPFAEDSEIRDVWVAGRRFEIEAAPMPTHEGDYAFRLEAAEGPIEGTLRLKSASSAEVLVGEDSIQLADLKVGPQHMHFHLEAEALSPEGVFSGTGLFEGEAIHGSLVGPNGVMMRWSATRTGDVPDEEEGSDDPDGDDPDGDDSDGDDGESAQTEEVLQGADGDAEASTEEPMKEPEVSIEDSPLPLPFGAHGLMAYPDAETVLIRNATVWTAADAGIVEGAVIVVEGGKIRYVGPEALAPVPDGARVIDAQGGHVTPGLIDCHSHTGISGGVNETGRRVTSEVRIGDVINPDDINFYRQLAGGLTAANLLHGSANAIGGQNAVIKLRWGASHPEEMKAEGAMPGIKFALGENPKRVAAGTDRSDEYPQTRMGVAALIEDRLVAGREYRESLERYAALSEWERARTMPPRRDLELEALGEIVAGERWIHCHSYRQDEILMLARLAQAFGFKIGTFQHVLEGYKVAEEIAEAAVGASTFSDWWAYKFEVVDAIPHNATLMSDVGVNVSINSDSSEHARRLNTEAAKAVKYGRMERAEAIKLVTLNPAIQLGLGDRTGSIEVGKDADLAIWSGDPLSYQSRCVSTFVDGRELFSLEADAAARAAAEAERQRIIQKLLKKGSKPKKSRGGWGRRGGGERLADRVTDRDLARFRDELEDQWRSGADPTLSRPGVCGCFDVLYEMAATRAGSR
ncbi:MAG: amidohydrolase family protein, partial [Planctomycetota bacterium]|nr:amidohydrolase family protein [Planctomycetota bacterium]